MAEETTVWQVTALPPQVYITSIDCQEWSSKISSPSQAMEFMKDAMVTWDVLNKRNLSIKFPSERDAQIAYRSLLPDTEPKSSGVAKQMVVTGNELAVRWQAEQAKAVRVSVGTFFDLLLLVVRTIDQFEPPSDI